MKKYQLFFTIYQLEDVTGGLTRAALNRANMLSDYFDEIGFITLNFNPDYEKVIERLRENGFWNDKMKMYNAYEFLMGESTDNKESECSVVEELDGEVQDVLDQEGRLRKRSFIDRDTQRVEREYFFRENGSCFLENRFDVIKDKTLSCRWYDERGQLKQEFKNITAYRLFMIDALADKKETTVMMSDGRATDPLLFAIKNPKIAKVALLHSNHLKSPYKYGSEIVEKNERLVKSIHQLDAFVTLTDRQAEDINGRFGRRQTIHVVGHPALTKETSHNVQKEPYTTVIVSRYSSIKQIDHAIRAFKEVSERIPQARLELWGFGPEEHKYREIIKELGLEKHVFVNGYARDVSEIYQRAAFSISTSKSEAFGMSIIESMIEGTPVIGYDCKYGPAEMIQHNQNGILIKPNVSTLAAAMVELFSNEEKRAALSKEARKIRDKYECDVITHKWLDVYEAAIKQKDQRVTFPENMKAEISNIRLKGHDIHVEGMVFVTDDNPLIRKHINLLLRLRRNKDIEDVYIPLDFEWVNSRTIQFAGKISNPFSIPKGTWDFAIHCDCLNAHQFLKVVEGEHLVIPKINLRSMKASVQVDRTEKKLLLRVVKPDGKYSTLKSRIKRILKGSVR